MVVTEAAWFTVLWGDWLETRNGSCAHSFAIVGMSGSRMAYDGYCRDMLRRVLQSLCVHADVAFAGQRVLYD
jgi:hypothetical protein